MAPGVSAPASLPSCQVPDRYLTIWLIYVYTYRTLCICLFSELSFVSFYEDGRDTLESTSAYVSFLYTRQIVPRAHEKEKKNLSLTRLTVCENRERKKMLTCCKKKNDKILIKFHLIYKISGKKIETLFFIENFLERQFIIANLEKMREHENCIVYEKHRSKKKKDLFTHREQTTSPNWRSTIQGSFAFISLAIYIDGMAISVDSPLHRFPSGSPDTINGEIKRKKRVPIICQSSRHVCSCMGSCMCASL